MSASPLPLSLALLVFAATGASSQQDSEAEAVRRANLAAQGGAPTVVATQPSPFQATRPAPADGAIAAALAQWRALQQSDSLPFDMYAGFLLAHPGWPGESANRRAAEKQAATASPANAIRFFEKFAPTSATGHVAYARALAASGYAANAAAEARTAWRSGALGPQDEAYILTSFASTLAPADHDARMDALLWQGATTSAARELPYTSPARQPIFAARLAFRTNAANAADLSGTTAELYRTDPGYVADRAMWLRGAGASPTARSWLARPRQLTSLPGNPAEWLEALYVNARAAANDGQWQLAYDIARQVDDAYPAGTDVSTKSYAERDQYTNCVWLAGQAALKHLGRAADAVTLFERYGRASASPQTRAKGFYWAGRAAEAAGQRDQAAAYFARTAGYRDQYYGQLAAERTGQPLAPPPPVSAPAIDPATRQAFFGRETVRAAQFLGNIGDHKDQTAFVRQIAADAKAESDHLLAAELSRQIGRPDLAVMVGRSALQNGLTDYAATGFPTVPVPVGYDGSWTMIHAIARQESQFDRAAISSAGARGLMQLMPGTAREQAGKMGMAYDPDALTTDPNLSMMLGSSYFQRIFANYGSYPLAIAAYNAGGGNVNKWLAANGDPRSGAVDMVDWIEAIPFSETRNYVQRVLENAVVYDLMNQQRATSRGATRLSWYLGKTSRPG